MAKLCDVHELICIARKVNHQTKARTLLGAPGTLSARLQPNHPTDDPRGITLLCYWGLALGSGVTLAVGVRCLPDLGKSGWWLLIGLIPLVGTIVLIVFACQDSQPGANQWGPSPKYGA